MNLYGHVTRFSDSSVYDEICVNCGATDGRGDHSLYKRCPKPPGAGGITLTEYYAARKKATLEREEKEKEDANPT